MNQPNPRAWLTSERRVGLLLSFLAPAILWVVSAAGLLLRGVLSTLPAIEFRAFYAAGHLFIEDKLDDVYLNFGVQWATLFVVWWAWTISRFANNTQEPAGKT